MQRNNQVPHPSDASAARERMSLRSAAHTSTPSEASATRERMSLRSADHMSAPTDASAARERMSLRSAMLMLVSGVAMSAAGFVADPFGEISSSVLWFLAQSLLYAGSIFGVTIYVQTRFAALHSSLRLPEPD